MKSVEFITTGSSNALGSFNTGDIAHNIPDDLAKHFVEEACCAKYYTGPAKDPEAKAAAQAPVMAKPRKPKAKPEAQEPDAPAQEFPPADPDAKGGENNPLTMADAEADLAGTPRPE